MNTSKQMNEDAFAFTDSLLGEGVTYETASSLRNGRRAWVLAELPRRYIISGDENHALCGVHEQPRWERGHQGGHNADPYSQPEQWDAFLNCIEMAAPGCYNLSNQEV